MKNQLCPLLRLRQRKHSSQLPGGRAVMCQLWSPWVAAAKGVAFTFCCDHLDAKSAFEVFVPELSESKYLEQIQVKQGSAVQALELTLRWWCHWWTYLAFYWVSGSRYPGTGFRSSLTRVTGEGYVRWDPVQRLLLWPTAFCCRSWWGEK